MCWMAIRKNKNVNKWQGNESFSQESVGLRQHKKKLKFAQNKLLILNYSRVSKREKKMQQNSQESIAKCKKQKEKFP